MASSLNKKAVNKAYAKTPEGKAARARAYIKSNAKRQLKPVVVTLIAGIALLVLTMNTWR